METDNPEASIAEAVAAAKSADAAILFVGTNQLLEREGLDREFLNLPPVQIALVRSVMEANPKTVIVLLNGGPVSLAPPFGGGGQRAQAAHFATVLDMFWAGEEGGTAIADVLFGDYNPSGRMPYTVYANERGLPPMTEYDISKGFTYMYLDGKPEFAFGPWTQLHELRLQQPQHLARESESGGSVEVHVDVKNSGDRAGDEVVQMYVHNNDTSTYQPKEQLQGFERISLKPGETKTVTFSLPVEQLAFWDTGKHDYVIHPGAFDVMLGAASDDVRQKGSFAVTTAGDWPASTLTTRQADGDYSGGGK